MSQAMTLSEEQKSFFEQEGYLVIKGLYSPEEVNVLNELYHKIWLRLMAGGHIQQAPNRPLNSLYPRLRDYHKDHEGITRFILKPEAMEALENLTGEEMLACQTSYYFKAPGASGLPLHQDNYSIGAYPDTTYAVWVSLDRSEESNGGLHVVPGSHRLEIISPANVPKTVNAYGLRLDLPEGYSIRQVENEPGDVVIFNGNILHGSSHNESEDLFRRAIVTHFARSSVEKITLNYSNLVNKHGVKVRRRLNSDPRVVETKETLFEFRDAKFYDQIIHRE
ncbi:phytanoyl-CoA dioxygenase family protein [Paenibacillus massiliensis]|uniref:phytanoyl-CoA dioxygenase family protein n=1 Tax=Paenibacillus massiliensis TaxID=225917 RepID=UPI000364296A|nr:phytanoyl-CoA dioxygenase family protein [Paenibacillus massiliensis]